MDYRDTMSDPEAIWRLGRWIADRASGVVRLDWNDGRMELEIARGRAVAVRGLDPAAVAAQLGCAPAGNDELLDEARALAQRHATPETQAVGAVKTLLVQALETWLRDPERRLVVAEKDVDDVERPTISLAHALVELLLSSEEDSLARIILPRGDALLRRTPNFLELYSPLRLSEEADLVVAKITGQRTVAEIAGRSPHGSQDVLRLLAGLVVTGMLEVVPPEEVKVRSEPLPSVALDAQVTRRRLPVGWLVAAGAALLLALALAVVLLLRPHPASSSAADGHWTVAVDMGCEPEDLQRILKKASQFPNDLQALRTDLDDGEPCWRLVWGSFTSEDEARAAESRVPSSFLRDGFPPHPVELPAGSPQATATP